MATIDIKKIQSLIQQQNIDGWLLYDFRASNQLALEILKIPASSHLTRRFFYYIPRHGNPSKIVNAIEAHNLAHLPGEELKYSSHESLQKHLSSLLSPGKKIAMEYSPNNAIPYLSKLDAGMYEYLKGFGIDIICSGDLITMFTAVWSEQQYQKNIPVAEALPEIVKTAFYFIKEKLQTEGRTTEYAVQQVIMNEFERRHLITDFPAIVAVNANSANPHYGPDENTFSEIKENDFILIDLWAKLDEPDAVYSDITWTGFAGNEIPEKYTKVFNIVRTARDAALQLAADRFAAGAEVRGYELDDAARNVIKNAGYGDAYFHRTGHSITTEVHGSGPHLDNYETRDERLICRSTSFSIEPGIYLTGDFGIRSEIDVFVKPDGSVIYTGGIKQEAIVAILK